MFKNKIKYIVSFVAIVFLLAMPAFVANAQQIANCTFPAGGTASGYTKAQCDNAGGTWHGSTGGGGGLPADGLGGIILQFSNLLNAIIPLLIMLGVVYFVWGVVQYVIGDEEEAKKKGKDRMIFGIIGFAVIIGMWGLVGLVVRTFDLNQAAPTITMIDFTSDSCDQLNTAKPGITNVFNYITCIINSSVIPLIFALASVSFVWGVVQYVINGDDEARKTKGRDFMLWGVIALTVMVSVWGLVSLLGSTFGVDNVIPQVTPPK